jgi:hypothetical protein
MCVCCVQIRSHAQKYFLKVQKLGLAAGLPPQNPNRRLAMPQPSQSSPDGSGVVAKMVLLGHPQQCPTGVIQSPIGWNSPGLLPASNGNRLSLPVNSTSFSVLKFSSFCNAATSFAQDVSMIL